MSEKAKKEVEYEFEDLRRNTDPIPGSVLDSLGLEEDDLDLEGNNDPKEEIDDDNLDDDGEFDKVKMTKEMSKRLTRDRRKHEQELNAVKAEGDERFSKLEKELAELKQGREVDELDEDFEAAKTELQNDIEAAMEAGDSKKVAELTVQLADVTTEARMKLRDIEEHDDPDDLDAKKVSEEAPKLKKKAQEWLNEQEWWDDEEYSDVREFVLRADRKLQSEGYSPDEGDFYQELERIVEDKFPDVITPTDLNDDDEDIIVTPKRKRRAGRSPVSGAGRSNAKGSGRRNGSKKDKTLSRTRVANMRMFGMDPDNPDHVEAYMKEI